jgi:hypothetical protein
VRLVVKDHVHVHIRLAAMALPALLGVLATGCPPSLVTLCKSSADCAEGYLCVQGTCRPPGTPVADAWAAAGDPRAPAEGVPCAARSFHMTETQELFEAPAGALFMHIKAWGAGGNGEGCCLPDRDGAVGGYTEAVFTAEPGVPLVVIVGKRGRAGWNGEERRRFGFGDLGGGGLSGVFRGPEEITNEDRDRALVIAGGGGSAGAPACSPGIPGNHEEAGGQPTMQGGPPGDDQNGGGGGYSGGWGGGKKTNSAGGTGYVAPEALEQRIVAAEIGDQLPPNAEDPDYVDGAGQEEASGHVVISFTCERPQLPPIL